jgi:hypothetical protein
MNKDLYNESDKEEVVVYAKKNKKRKFKVKNSSFNT